VWKGTHPLIGKVVAIKVLAKRFSVDPDMVSRFVAEARAVNQIRHRHIVDIFSFGYLDDGRAYYVMEYLDGETLDLRIEREAISLADAIPILRGIARALDAAHAKGIAHRDLKAENVLVTRDDDGAPFPKLLDFGIAKLLAPEDGISHKTRTGAPIGTPYYMSPEQCRGRDVDHRTDYYAFGVLAYLMLTRTFPIDGDDYMSILMAQMTREPAPASSLVTLPAGVDDVLAWLMQKQAAKRPPSLAAAMTALEAAATTAGIAVATPTSMASVPALPSDTPLPSDLGSTAKPPTPPSHAKELRPEGLPEAVTLPASSVVNTRIGGSSKPRPWIAAAIVAGVIAAVAIVIVSSERSELHANRLGAKHERGAEPGADVDGRVSANHSANLGASVDETIGAHRRDDSSTDRMTKPDAATIVVTIDGSPERFDAVVGGHVISVLPGTLTLERSDQPVTVTFREPGFVPQKRSIVPDHKQTLTIHLERRPTPTTTALPAKDPHSTENPFP
jgi:serine/threonine-protein kinase